MENIRLVNLSLIDRVEEILIDAKELLSLESTQWQQGYPNKESFINDIKNNRLFGYFIDNVLVGVIALVPGYNVDYDSIEGKWEYVSGDSDITIHRICVKKDFYHQKIGDKLFKYSIEYAKRNGYKSIKVDTYPTNERLKALAINNNFIYKGIIYIKRNEINKKRFAYEYVVD